MKNPNFNEAFGDVFTNTHGVIMHGCNTRGYMGAGVAALVRNKFPKAYQSYRDLCDSCFSRQELLLGRVQFIRVSDTLIIANAFTQVDPGPCAEASAIKQALTSVMCFASGKSFDVHSVQIGCGIGGLEWDDIAKIYNDVAGSYPNTNVTAWEY